MAYFFRGMDEGICVLPIAAYGNFYKIGEKAAGAVRQEEGEAADYFSWDVCALGVTGNL